MSQSNKAFVTEARLTLLPDADPAAVGAAVTTELCGHWEHDGPCRWPHNNRIEPAADGFTFRTLFVAPPEDEDEVRGKIENALRGAQEWEVARIDQRDVAPSETALAARLANAPPQ